MLRLIPRTPARRRRLTRHDILTLYAHLSELAVVAPSFVAVIARLVDHGASKFLPATKGGPSCPRRLPVSR
jgi:hypothetical protein